MSLHWINRRGCVTCSCSGDGSAVPGSAVHRRTLRSCASLCRQEAAMALGDRLRGRGRGVQPLARPGLDTARDLLCVACGWCERSTGWWRRVHCSWTRHHPGTRQRVPGRVTSNLGAGSSSRRRSGCRRSRRQRGCGLLPASWQRGSQPRWRWITYAVLGGVSAATVGPWLVVVLLGCGFVEMGWRRFGRDQHLGLHLGPFCSCGRALPTGGLLALAWVAIKVGALSYGGGFVIIPLMQNDAVEHYHWMTNSQFLTRWRSVKSHRDRSCTPSPSSATPRQASPVGLLAAAIAFSPSFVFVLVGARHFDSSPSQRKRPCISRWRRTRRDRRDPGCRDPARSRTPRGMAARGTRHRQQSCSLSFRRGVVLTLLLAAAAGLIAAQLGAPLP